jgi:hypothetical protein
MKNCLIIGSMNFVAYLLLVFNFRAVAQGRYLESIISDTLIASMGFSMVKKIGEATTLGQRFSFILGGSLASGLGIWITKQMFHQ